MPDIEIKRGYEVLPDNNIRFGIRITNISELALSDVEVMLEFTESLFKIEGERLQKVGVIPPTNTRTAEFVLKPLSCVHNVNIEALISYRDAKWQRYRIDMHPKEVHCVCPFLKGMKIPRAEFLELSGSGHSSEMGLNFRGVTVDRLTSFLVHTCKSRHYKVDDFSIEGGRMLYLASESIGEKAYYLLTALIKEEDDLTQVMMRAVSDKPYGLNGFLNETVADLRHVVSAVRSAQEIGVIKKEQVINIIDSVVQRTTFGGGEGGASVNIKDSVVQRIEFKGDEGRKRRKEVEAQKEEKERQRKAQELAEHGRKAREEGEKKRTIEADRQARELQEQRAVTGVKSSATAVVIPSADNKGITNSIGMEFVQIPSGEFTMGSPSNEAGRFDWEGPVHRVKISNAFYMSKYEVTQKQWIDIMGSCPSKFKGDNLPVEMVSWDDAQNFINKLNKKEGGGKYRLPSESEWEYSARARTTTGYSFGDDESKLGEYAWFSGNSGSKTNNVGQKKPNPWGLYDMHGNVLEWVQDNWLNDYNDAPTDGSSCESGSDRVVRGGGWSGGPRNCRSASRNYDDPGYSRSNLSFRLLREM